MELLEDRLCRVLKVPSKGMRMLGPVERYLVEKMNSEGSIHVTLIDPEKVSCEQAVSISKNSNRSGTAAIMIGGSTVASQNHLDDVVKAVGEVVEIPTILFPNNVAGLSRHADALWFMSLLNSADPYFLMGAQILGAPLVKKFGLEPISMGYIIVGEGGAAGVMGKAMPIPYSKPEVAAAHALAGQFLGMHFIYLEGGSGAAIPVPPEMIRTVRNAVDSKLIIGGGIKTKEQAQVAASAGADIIVTGNIVESAGSERRVAEIIDGLRKVKQH
jgi:phosphoglycerol geranylgeranyltransferase